MSVSFIRYYYNDVLTKHFITLPACVSGYYGINCSSDCIFPLYGMNCMSNRNCSENDCDRVYGCLKSNEGINSVFTFLIWYRI